MKLFKKVMSLIIASIMMLQVAALAATAPADVDGTNYENAAKLLSALEIMVGDGNSFNGDKNITRAEFTKIMVLTAGHANIVTGYKAKGAFTDVDVNEWYAPYVEFGKDMGAINGMGDGTFAPNNNVTGEQAIKMMVSTIGYGLKAEASGGYPAGYITVAQDIGAMKGLMSLDPSAPITRGQAAILCANILEIDVMKKVSSGDKEAWESKEGITLLAEKFNVKKFEGLVSANSATSLWELSALKEGEVEITVKGEQLKFLVGETDLDKKIGATVSAYCVYDNDTEKYTVISYTISSKKNTAIELDRADIDFDESTNELIKYWSEESDTKAQEIEVEDMPAIIYNGAATASTATLIELLESVDGMPGNVVFMDTDNTEGAETVMITAYDTFVIEYIDAENFILYDEIGDYKNGNGGTKSITIDIDDKNVTASFKDKNGKELDFDALQEGDVVSVAASDPAHTKQIFDIYVCDDVAEGAVKEFGKNANGETIVVLDDGNSYMFADTLKAYFDAKGGHGLKLGKGVQFRLDAFGRVVSLESASSGKADGEYAFVLEYVPTQSTTGSIMVKVFTAAGEFAVLPFAAKVQIDGVKYSDDGAIWDAFDYSIVESYKLYDATKGYSTYADGTPAKVAPMLYELDDRGAIKYVDTPYFNEDAEDEYTLGKIKGGSTGPKEMRYNSSYKGFDTTLALNSSAVIFAVPSNASDLEDAKRMRVFKTSELSSETYYTFQFFNTDREDRAYTYGIHVTTETSDPFKVADTDSNARKRPNFIVTKTAKTLVTNEDGEEVITLKLYGNEEGTEKTVVVDPDYYADGSTATDTFADHLFNGVTYDYYGKNRAVRITSHEGVRDELRAEKVILPGDIIVYGTNSAGRLHYVRTIYLAHEAIFVSKNYIDDGRRYESTDFAIPVEKDGSSVMFSVISNRAEGSYQYREHALTIKDGLVCNKYGATEPIVETDASGKLAYAEGQLDANMTFNVSKVIVYDAAATTEAKRVTTGSVADIVDLTNPSSVATPCIVRVYNTAVQAVIVLKNLPDVGELVLE